MTSLNIRDANTGKFLEIDLANPSGTIYVNDYNTGEVVPVVLGGGGGGLTEDQTLMMWTESKAYQMLSVTYDTTYPSVISTATVLWPDGSAGTLTITSFDSAKLVELGFTITHTNSGKTVTQAAVTLNSYGFVITKPALTVA